MAVPSPWATLLAALARVSSDFDARNEAACRGHAKALLWPGHALRRGRYGRVDAREWIGDE